MEAMAMAKLCGQTSLEALAAFAALLCALALLAHAAKAQADAFASSIIVADERTSLAREAFYIDLSAELLPGASLSRNLTGVPDADGKWLASKSSARVKEPMFHEISVNSEGEYYVLQETQ
jgi:hypothetical protein